MTATDKAFIRLFDGQAGPQEMAPHVSFAARGGQLTAAFEPVIVWGGAPAEAGPAVAEAARAPRAAAAVAAPTQAHSQAVPRGAAPHFRTASSAPRPSAGTNTYLPSAFRNLVDVEEPTAGFQPSAASEPPAAPERPAASKPYAVFPPPPATQPAHRSHRREDPPAAPSGRRPLAEILYQGPPPAEFRPALEVDRLRWPGIVIQMLEECASPLADLADVVQSAGERGERVSVFHSMQPHAGCTTLTLAVARLLACRGRSIAVLDADFLRPQLAGAIGLVLAEGWEVALLRGVALTEFVIRSLEDGLSIVPLIAPLSEQEICKDGLAPSVTSAVRQLAAHHDLVLVDGGCPAASELGNILAAVADGCVLVSGDDTAGADLSNLDPGEGPPVFGIVANRAAVC